MPESSLALTVQDRICHIIDSLGDSPDRIASQLERFGSKGVRNAVRQLNPLLKFLHTQVPSGAWLDVIQGNVLHIVLRGGKRIEIALPVEMIEFLDAFNRGRYPRLEQ